MSVHIGTKQGEIAETVLLAGDPLRARFVAEQFLEDAVCYNEIRAMYGYTGTWKGKRISVQGSGMGIPSMAIYAQELMDDYGVKRLIRIGSCGAIQDDIKLRDIIVAQGASTDSAFNRQRFSGDGFAPLASFSLLQKTVTCAEALKLPVRVGNILSSDFFYQTDPESWKRWAQFNVLAIEMESVALYTLAAERGIEAVSILTVSDLISSQKAMSAEDRERSFSDMVRLALDVGIG